MKILFIRLAGVLVFFSFYFNGLSQVSNEKANKWVDSVFKSLTDDQRIAQLIVVRLSSIDVKTKKVTWYDSAVTAAVQKYNIGGICLFQGDLHRQAELINYYQSIAQVPIMISIDAEWGVGHRFLDSVGKLPYQLTLGAMQNESVVYEMGRVIGRQCRRMGIHVNYAPVVDVNNNPNNPVINFRSFGEDKYKVAQYGVAIMKGMQDEGIMACAKHFPGHGDVTVDSHLDLPVITKTRNQLDSLELYPFREIFKAGIGSVMIAHLSIPAIDNTANKPTSISYNNITTLMRNELGYQGLTFTDALEMQGVKKYYPDGEASAQAIIAGNDMLCLPGDIPATIKKIRRAIKKKKLKWADVYAHTKRVLMAKYEYVLPNAGPIEYNNLTNDLNSSIAATRKTVAQNAITLLKNDNTAIFPLSKSAGKKIAYVGIGINDENNLAKRLKKDFNADVFYVNYSDTTSLLQSIKSKYDVVVVGVHNYANYPANNFNISNSAVQMLNQLEAENSTITLYFGNAYAIKNSCNAKNILVCYEDDAIFQEVAADILKGLSMPKGKLPVTVCDNFKLGCGIVSARYLPIVNPSTVGINNVKLNEIDSIAMDAITKKAFPGCVVLAAKDGRVFFEKSYGYYTYDSVEPLSLESIFDLASVTKISATNISVMKLYDEGKLDIKKNLGYYLPWVKGTDKEKLLIEDILLHQAGLKAWIPFYKETIDTITGIPFNGYYSPLRQSDYSVRVTDKAFMRTDWKDTMYKRILQSPLTPPDNYIYSDNDFIFLGLIIEAITGISLDEYVKKTFYDKLDMKSTGFKPTENFSLERIVPTEMEKQFRLQLLRGDVHDPGAAMFGGVAGHAGLFSNVHDLAILWQMVLNGGTFNGQQFLKSSTINFFTAYNSAVSRRGLGFDKPEKDNAARPDPYPCRLASPRTFGHTGYTGTCVWVDPRYNLIYIFLSNRVYPDGGVNTLLTTLNVRGKIQDVIYEAINHHF
ncbi:MAG TPA: glycoside hydrolase family 3 N-terminal domain-containing protein [Chitinophagaceae bacterium]|nr:glycoside hydrolase family 3 N-terminal domain-containing protein [Chitinophagaceae bacterium]